MDQLYLFETYCDTNFIRQRKHKYLKDKQEEKIFSQDKLDIMNIKRSFVGARNIFFLIYVIYLSFILNFI